MTESDIKKAARGILRNYLIRCHRSISANYAEIKDLSPEAELNTFSSL
jgi:DNA-binding LytR/AlgR family response regulator